MEESNGQTNFRFVDLDMPNEFFDEHGGWVKAMAYVDPGNGIVRCYNSQASGLTRTLPPCGFTFTYEALGQYIVSFGFDVSDRFILANALFGGGLTHLNIISGTSVNLFVRYSCCGRVGETTDAPFFIFVY